MATTQGSGEVGDRLYARSWRIAGAGRPDVSALRDLEAGQARARNAAAGALVVTDGASLEVDICDVLMSHPVQGHLAPELRRDPHG